MVSRDWHGNEVEYHISRKVMGRCNCKKCMEERRRERELERKWRRLVRDGTVRRFLELAHRRCEEYRRTGNISK